LIQDLEVYHDSREGFRLAPPRGWRQHGRGQYPPGQYDKERDLLKYRSLDEGKVGVFRVSMIDLPEAESATAYLAAKPPGPERWSVSGTSEPLKVGGLAAERVTFSGVWEGRKADEPVTKEVVAVRRGGRVYFFAAIFLAGDKDTRDVARKVLSSVAWDSQSGG
jgi:hypothetical protein